ncbi:MAG: MlaD family protein [Bdellovibrionota bacterium]
MEHPARSGAAEWLSRWRGRIVLSLFAALLLVGAWTVWKERERRNRFFFKIRLEEAAGVTIGTPVRISGIAAGEVEAIEFAASRRTPTRLLPVLTLSIDRRMKNAVRRDLRVEVNRPLVLGDIALDITPGTTAGEPVEEGALIDLVPAPPEEGGGVFSNAAGKIRKFFSPEETPAPASP